MLFNSLAFVLFFPLVVCIYYAIPASRLQARRIMLLAASYYFYMNWQPIYALLLLGNTVVTYAAAIGISRSTAASGRRRWLAASIVLNLAVLFLFKYYNFATDNIEWALRAAGLKLELPPMSVLLPVGISFYIFQALGYSIDVYRGTTRVERDFVTYALFVAFFPQLVAGPIERSSRLLPQFKRRHRFSYPLAMQGLRLMVWGYFLKLVVADRCGIYVDAVFNNLEQHNGGSYLLASMLFPWQIYGDFAGYSLIAIGAARIMGFRLMANFRQPYLSQSVGEFWHRWHVSLSTWFKDYVYIPLGGNRAGRGRTYWNLMVTFAVSGIWHGAAWTFVCWGLLHGVLLCLERALGLSRREHGRWRWGRWALTFMLVCAAWVLFRANSMADAATIFAGIATDLSAPLFGRMEMAIISMSLLLVVLVDCCSEWHPHLRLQPRTRYVATHVGLALLIAYIVLLGMFDSSQFIYFQF